MAIGRAAAAGLVLTVSAAAGAAALLRARPGAGAAAPAPLEAVSRGDLELRFREVGDVAAKVSVNVASQASGRVVSLHAREGDLVAAGQRLAVVQPGRAQSERYLPSTVSAPLAGVVLRCLKGGKDAEPSFSAVGDYVTGSFESQSPTCLMTIADMSRLVVRLKISEMDILKLEAGMPVRVSVDALPGASFPGKVSLVAPQAEKESTGGKFFRVEVELDRADRRLKSGMTAQVDALLSRRQDVLKIPAAAVFEEEGRTVVYVGSPARAVPVEVGLRTDMEAEIRSGLEEGQRVFVERPGAPGGAS